MKISENFIYLIILGIGVNLFVEMIKTENMGNKTLLFAWLIGVLACMLTGFDFLYRIGLIETRYYFFDFVFSGFLCANISRFLHKFYELLKQYKEIKNNL